MPLREYRIRAIFLENGFAFHTVISAAADLVKEGIQVSGLRLCLEVEQPFSPGFLSILVF
jgi:hypothetical protein